MTGLKTLIAAGAVAAAMSANTPSTAQTGAGIALRDVSVVDTRTGAVTSGRTVLIRNGRIEDIVASDAEPDSSYRIIDGAGHYVVPGYNDMHVHAVSPDGLRQPEAGDSGDHDHGAFSAASPQVLYDLMLANGITGYRQMSGSSEVLRAAREINAAIEEGTLVAPEVLQVTGDLYLGQAPTAEAARAFVRAQKEMGSDFLKVIEGPREGVLAAIEEAEALGMDVAGHLPNAISTQDAIERGWDAFEHLGSVPGTTLDCAGAGAAIRARMNEGAGGPMDLPPTFILNPLAFVGNKLAPALGAIRATFDPDMCRALARDMKAAGVWQVPTLIRLRTMSHGGDAAYRSDPNLRYLPKATRDLWERMGAQFESGISAEAREAIEANYELTKTITGMMKDEGVPMLAGSDLGGIWVLPGFSLHQEFAELEKAGFTPLQILQTTTLNAAVFLKREDDMGQVAPGHMANLVLLEDNPLDAVANLASIAGVISHGTYLDAARLAAMKDRIAEAAHP